MSRNLWTELRSRLRRLLPGLPDSGPSAFIRVAYKAPRQVVLVTTRWKETDNLWAMDWHIPLSEEPPLYGISLTPDTYGAELIEDEQEDFSSGFIAESPDKLRPIPRHFAAHHHGKNHDHLFFWW